MKVNRNNRNRQFLSSWLTASVVVVAMLLLMFILVQATNTPVDAPVIPDSSSEQSTQTTQQSFPPEETTTTPPSTTTTTSTTTTASTTTTTKVSTSNSKCRITAEYANVRSGPGAGYDYVKRVYSGESYSVLGQKNASNGVLWYQIDLGGGTTGYVCSAFVSFSGDPVSEPVDNSMVVGGEAYLTFDDGPSKNTPKILDILDQYGVKATFFVMYNRGQDEYYRQIVERGHTIALHTYSHEYADIYKSQSAFFNDLDKISDHVESLTGVRATITRFPGGSSNTISRKHCAGIMTALTKEVEARGYNYFDWNVDSGDADDTTVDKDVIVSNIKNRTHSYKRVFILMHDAKSKTTTVEALPEIIEYLQSRGYTILPITDSTEPLHHKVNN